MPGVKDPKMREMWAAGDHDVHLFLPVWARTVTPRVLGHPRGWPGSPGQSLRS